MQKEQRDVQGVTLRLPIEEYEALRTYAFVTGAKINDVVRRAVLSFLAHEGREDEMTNIVNRIRDSRRVALDKLADM